MLLPGVNDVDGIDDDVGDGDDDQLRVNNVPR